MSDWTRGRHCVRLGPVRRSARTLLCLLVAGVYCSAAAGAASAAVKLNEVSCEATDWIELVNTGGSPADISGWLLTDDDLSENDAGHRFTLASGTTIPANGRITVDKGTAPAGFPFGIGCDDTIVLASSASATIAADHTTIGRHDAVGETWGRLPDAAGAFADTTATKGAPNQPSPAAADPDPAGWLFNPTQVTDIDLGMTQADYDALAAAPGGYHPATFTLTAPGRAYGPLDVGLRLRGVTSFRDLDHKAGFKLKFNEYDAGQRFFGLKKLNLHNMVQDPSMMRETLSYEVFDALGIATPRTGYAAVSLRGTDYGLYTSLEPYDDISLPRSFASTRHLYEAFFGLDARSADVDEFEIDEGDAGNRSDLQALAAAVEAPSPSFSERLGPVADLPEMIRVWTIEKYLGHWDGYAVTTTFEDHEPNNYYLHSDDAGRFSILPWGTDQTFVDDLPFDGPSAVMVEQCRADPPCWSSFRQDIALVPTATTGLDAQAAALKTMLAPYQVAVTDDRHEFDAADFNQAVSDLRVFLARRPAQLFDPAFWVAGPPLELSAPPPGEPAADTKPPKTSITAAPNAVVKTKRAHARARFRFASSEADSTFSCRLDDGSWKSCESPKRVRVERGNHRFRVRATDAAGNRDPTPAKARWSLRPR